jgi:hypothetical protein
MNGVCEGFAHCDINVALALSNTAALLDQEDEPIHERRNRSYAAWQRALQSESRRLIDDGLQSFAFLFEKPHHLKTITR